MKLILILLFSGILFLYLEFFLPGLIMGLIGCGLVISSIVYFCISSPSLYSFVFYFLLTTISIALIVKLALYQIKKTKDKNTFYLGSDQSGYKASISKTHLIGKRGTTLTDLKPSGHVSINNKKITATSDGEYMDKGENIVVIGEEGSRIIVKREIN